MAEIQRLNFADLDVEALEHRLELAAASSPEGYTCGTDCTTYQTCDIHGPQPVEPQGGGW